MRRIQAISQHQAGAEMSRVHATFPCAMNRASWLVPSYIGITTDAKPRPRRHALTS
jgi:hypothetical protein